MARLIGWLALGGTALAAAAAVAATDGDSASRTPAGELVLERALPIEGPARFQPSGLVVHDGGLWTVSDKPAGRGGPQPPRKE